MITLIPTNKLKPHPKNPRLVMREDVIESIKAGLADGFHPSYALQVWPQGDDYFILSGHHRTESARRHGIQEVPCFVREDLDEDEAYMVLATANAQGELSPLEIGMHALHYVEKGTGGRGQRGGLSAYAEAVGKSRPRIMEYKDAAEVAEKVSDTGQVSDLLTKAAHLAAIHKLPEGAWSVAVEAMLKQELSAKDTQKAVEDALEAASEIPKAQAERLHGVEARVMAGKVRRKGVRDLVAILSEIDALEEQVTEGELTNELNPPADWWDIREVSAYRDEIAAVVAEAMALRPTVYRTDALSLLGTIEDGSVDLIITDPPYATDIEDIAAFAKSWVPVAIKKLAKTGRAYICTGAYPAELAAYATELLAIEGLKVGVPLVWTYNNTIGPAPTHDYKTNWQSIWHVYREDAPPINSPILTEKNTVHTISAPDGRHDGRLHAWQKPDELAQMLIRHALAKPGATVVDPFSGTGTFLVAASKAGHKAIGSEVSEDMIKIQAGRGIRHE
jgi:site-specific DNA-methyltransferase (adenine-specific)